MRLQKLLIVIAPCLCLSFVVSAHQGGTDSDGGHTDRSTGEYHYHHGYSAHSHYDMDGDGDWDCPYSFGDKTNSSNSHAGSYTITKKPSDNNESSQDEIEPPVIKNESKKETTKKRTFSDYVEIISGLFFGSMLLLSILGAVIDKIRKRLKK